MADNVAITAGGSTTIRTDDVGSGAQAQYVKLMDGTDGSAVVVTADATKGLNVNTRRSHLTIGYTNLTGVGTGAHIAGDALGTVTTLTGVVGAANAGGRIFNATMIDKSDTASTSTPTPPDAWRLWLLSATPGTTPTDDAALSITNSDIDKVVAVLDLGTPIDAGTARIWQWTGEIAFNAGGTSLYAIVQCGAGITPAASTDVAVALRLMPDV
jgi:hypothetical protein